MRTVVVVGALEPIGTAALELIGDRRADFMVDGLVDEGREARRLAELVVRFTPLRLGITDEYSVRPFRDEREDIALDQGLVDWELPEVDVFGGTGALAEVAGLQADITVVALVGDEGAEAVAAARAAGTHDILVGAELAGDGLVVVSEESVGDVLVGLLPTGR